MAYSSVDDLLLGSIPLSSVFSKEKYVEDAGDEIDSYIGVLYDTPVDISDAGPVARHSILLLKRINNFLATGRIILAIDAGGEDTALHAYGLRMVNEALASLTQVASGAIPLDGAVRIPTANANTGPSIKNADAASAVDAFYNRVMVPESGAYGLPYRDWAPGDNPNGTVA